jgi:hypothetical protein
MGKVIFIDFSTKTVTKVIDEKGLVEFEVVSPVYEANEELKRLIREQDMEFERVYNRIDSSNE